MRKTAMGRRKALIGAAVVAAGAKASAPAIAGSPHPDARLIALCAGADRVERSLQAVPDDEAMFTAAYEATEATQDEAYRQICDIPATTIEGLRARAASARLWNKERQYHPEWEAGLILELDRATWRDLGGRPHPVQHDGPYVANNEDAVVITGWRAVEDLEWRRLALFAGPGRIHDDNERDEAIKPISASIDKLRENIDDIRAVTMDGVRAKARAAVLMNTELIREDEAAAGGVVASLLVDLVGDDFLARLMEYLRQSREQSDNSGPSKPPPQPGEDGYIPGLAEWRAAIHESDPPQRGPWRFQGQPAA